MKSLLQGIWLGMTLGTLLQTAILVFISYRTKWEKQVGAVLH
jgi:MATE family multidrug resistance protein